MNPLLSQFLAEANDLLASVDDGLLQLERNPGDPELVNEVFRAAHTFKGSSGLFDFPELTRLTHAAEDLLDAVRGGRLALDSGMADDLLAAFDLIRGWLAHVTAHERLPATAGQDAAGLITKLRAPLGGEPSAADQEPIAAVRHVDAAPDWLAELGTEWLIETATWLNTTSSTLRFLRYLPDQDCFFRAEDPLHLVRQIPGLDRMVVVPPATWPAVAEYDEYACLLSFVVATRASYGELHHLFRYVPDQVSYVELDAAAINRHLEGEDAEEITPPPVPEPLNIDPGLAADARAVLTAAHRTLAVGEPAGTQLVALTASVTAAARALGVPLDLTGADAEAVNAAVEGVLGRAPAEGAAEPPGVDSPVIAALAAPPAPVPAAEPAGRADDPGGQVGTRVLKVDQEKVDRLMELVGELNVAKNGLTFLAAAAEEEFGSRALSRRIKDQYAGLHRIAEELQAAVMDVRMLPLSVAFGRFPRLVRDLSRRLGKTIELVTEGDETMADKDVIEALGDPLVHLVRNSLDHGIETTEERIAAGKPGTARLTLAAVADGDAVLVEVSDDGRGVNPARVKQKAYEKGLISEEELESLSDSEAVDLVFRPGFSTADQISDLSGRGVGMDAVRASVEKLGGSVTMRSELGTGTTTRLRLPLSMAVTQVMVVSVAGQRFGVPVDLVVETVRVPAAEMGRVLHQDVVVMRGEVVPVIDLARALQMPWAADPDRDRAVLIVSVNGQRVGLLVEQFHREVDVILKPMEGLLAYADEFSGTALLGDGLVLLVLNLKEVLGLAARAA
ncbi:histidine kinase [Actinoplanes sp. SE50]|uniref:chemotaxis protein CheA n=1 Tax=unclassified Actinoplanes TaxID=2626549 RepID=UPI00023EC387|nr:MULTISPECIES: chemotaxis protein CheA [unclassified Actinoplanes]AEV88009.1 two-component system, chemotaxis family, sensor kinase CheA [Actinoplanes sp. SE50/110]ATO86413.1 histidine kinase [Actinoplanes sp. SE50]SLM03828.1 chemotaxis protein CheA [Actinoplanes sp. SE50/110]